MRTSAAIFSRRLLRAAALFLVLAVLASCGGVRYKRGRYIGHATVSWYGPGFHNKLTASGERYNMNALTCAHKKLPFGTKLRLVNDETGDTVDVVVNDRGPFVRGRDIDLSKAAAKRLGIIGPGTGEAKVYYLGRDKRYAKYIQGGSIASSANDIYKGPYTIQVAAFTDRGNADYLKEGLDLNHKQVYIMEKWINGTRYFRVRLGKFKNEGNARQYATSLADEGYSCQVIPYEKL
jgi:rare lipoprotein A